MVAFIGQSVDTAQKGPKPLYTYLHQKGITIKKTKFMKKLITLSFVLSALLFANTTQAANGSQANTENPGQTYEVFKKTVITYFKSSGQFLQLSTDEKTAFFEATEQLKASLSTSQKPFAAHKLAKVELSEALFKFIWENKVSYTEPDLNLVAPNLD